MTLSSLFLTVKFEFVIISRHLVVKMGTKKSSVLKEFIKLMLPLTFHFRVMTSFWVAFYLSRIATGVSRERCPGNDRQIVQSRPTECATGGTLRTSWNVCQVLVIAFSNILLFCCMDQQVHQKFQLTDNSWSLTIPKELGGAVFHRPIELNTVALFFSWLRKLMQKNLKMAAQIKK